MELRSGSNTSRSPLGCDDPCASRDDIEDADPDTEKLSSLLDALELDDHFKTDNFTVAEVVEKARKNAADVASYGGDLTALHEAVPALCWKGEINARAVGNAFSKYWGRIIGERRLIRAGTRNKVAVWKVETV